MTKLIVGVNKVYKVSWNLRSLQKDIHTKEQIANHIIDKSNMIDIIVTTLMKKSTIKGQFVIIKNYLLRWGNRGG